MSRTPRVLCFGSVHQDFTYHLARIVGPGETVRSARRSSSWGGKGLNQAVALAAAGIETTLLARTGRDYEGLRQFLAKHKVDAHLLTSDEEEPTGHAIVQLDAAGNNCIVIYSGANRTHSLATLMAALGEFAEGDMLVVQNETNHVAEAIASAKRAGLLVAYNPSPINDSAPDVDLHQVDYLFLNEHEAVSIGGHTDPQVALQRLASELEHTGIIMTLGSEGAIFQHGIMTARTDALQPEVVDTTGAGDTFTGFFVATVLRGGDPHDALSMASRAAAVAVSRLGAAAAIPTWQEVATVRR